MSGELPDDIYGTLHEVPLLSELTEEEIAALVDRCPARTVAAGEQILSPSKQADCFYTILSGRVRIFKLSPKGDQQVLHVYGPGDTFGEAAMWKGIRFPAHAEATEDSCIMSVDRSVLRKMIDENTDLAMGMLAGMSSKLHEFNRLIEQISLREVPARLAAVLLEMPTGPGTNTVVLKETKRELAARIGTVAETLSRALAKLKTAGLIEVDGAEITILDPDGLEAMLED